MGRRLPFWRGRGPARDDSPQPWERADDLPIWAEFFKTRAQVDRFEAQVRNYFQARGQEALVADGMVVRADGDYRYGLSNVGQLCAAAPAEQWPGLIAGHFDAILRAMSHPPDLDDSDLSALRDRLVVRLYDVDDLGDVPLAGAEAMPGLFAALMLDEEHAARSVRAEDAARWDTPIEEVLQTALDNLERIAAPGFHRVDMDDAGVAHMAFSESIYGGALACRVDRFADLVGPHGALVAAPVRNMFVSVPIHGPEIIQAVGRILGLVHHAYAEGPGSVSRRLYWFRDGQWTELPWALEDGRLSFLPPGEFVEMLNGLVE